MCASKLDLMNSLKRAQHAWHTQARSKRNFLVGLFRPSGKNSEFSLAIKEYSRKLLTALQHKHFDFGPDFVLQHTKLVGHYVGNLACNNTSYTYRSMKSLVVGIPKDSCLIDYLATTDKATYGHLVANNAFFLLNQPPKMLAPNLQQPKHPAKRGRNEDLALPGTKRVRYFNKHTRVVQVQQARHLPNKPGHKLDLQKLRAISVSLNAPIVVTHRKLDGDDFDETKHAKMVVQQLVACNPASKSVMSRNVAHNSKIWVDTSQVSPEMFVLYCSKRNIVGSSNLGKTLRNLRSMLDKLPAWFYTDLLEYSNMAQVDLSVLAELITSQSLLCDLYKL